MTDANKHDTMRNINRMEPRDATNLWHGILSGIKLFGGDTSQNVGRLPAIMVLTDGQPNHMCPPQGYVPKLRAMEQLPATIHTFGFGYSLRSGLLKSIAEVSGGNYAFIPDAGMIGTVFVHAVANLQSTYAKNATLKLTYPHYMQLEVTTGESVDQQEAIQLKKDGDLYGQLSICLENIQYGQSRDICLRCGNLAHLRKILDLTKEGENPAQPPIVEAVLQYSSLHGVMGSVASRRSLIDRGAPVLTPAEVAYHVSRSAIIELLNRTVPIRKKDGEHVPVTIVGDLVRAATAFLDTNNEKSLVAAQPRYRDDPQCKSLLEDLEGVRSEAGANGQILLALEETHFRRWGQHYLPSLANAHAKQICNSFKDPGPLMYCINSPLFLRCRDRLDAAFDSLPAPKPSNHTGHRGHVSMSRYNRSSNPCFAGNASVVIAGTGTEGKAVRIARLRPGMSVETPCGSRKVVAVIKTMVNREPMCLVSKDLIVTPWHPVCFDGSNWAFPAHTPHRPVRYTGSIYSVLLEKDPDLEAHAIMVGGIWGVTLGHGQTDTRQISAGDVRAHTFLGDYDAVFKSVMRLRKAGNGVRMAGGMVRNKDTGLMSGFKRVHIIS